MLFGKKKKSTPPVSSFLFDELSVGVERARASRFIGTSIFVKWCILRKYIEQQSKL